MLRSDPREMEQFFVIVLSDCLVYFRRISHRFTKAFGGFIPLLFDLIPFFAELIRRDLAPSIVCKRAAQNPMR